MEEWKDLTGFEGLYKISSYGRFYSVRRDKVMRSRINKNGYCQIGLRKNGPQRTFLVHRLVALEFIDNPHNKKEVNHIDGNKQNNCIDNLEWVTTAENAQHSVKLGRLFARGETSGTSKLSESEVKEIRELRKIGWPLKKLSSKFNVSLRNVCMIVYRDTWKHI